MSGRVIRVAKLSAHARTVFDRLGLEPLEALARIAMGDVECPYCAGGGCASVGREFRPGICDGQGREWVPLALRIDILKECSKYVYPRLASVQMIDGNQDSEKLNLAHEKAEKLALLLDAADTLPDVRDVAEDGSIEGELE